MKIADRDAVFYCPKCGMKYDGVISSKYGINPKIYIDQEGCLIGELNCEVEGCGYGVTMAFGDKLFPIEPSKFEKLLKIVGTLLKTMFIEEIETEFDGVCSK